MYFTDNTLNVKYTLAVESATAPALFALTFLASKNVIDLGTNQRSSFVGLVP